MKGRRHARWVGGFVVAGLVLAVGAVLSLGGGRIFRDRVRYVMFFSGAVNGLQEGAPVTFRGVKVGTVTALAVAVGDDNQPRIPVYIELDAESFRGTGSRWSRADLHQRLEALVEEGLRAQLQVQSILTGLLMVQLDFFPEEPPRLVGGDLSVPELPTRQSGLQRLTESVDQIQLDQMAKRALAALEGIDRLVNSEQLQEGLADSAATLRDLRQVVAELRRRTGPVGDEIGRTTASLRELIELLNDRVEPLLGQLESTTQETHRLMTNVNAAVDRLTPKVEAGVETTTRLLEESGRQFDLEKGPAAELLRNLTRASASAERSLEQAQQTLQRLEQSAGPGSPLESEATALLGDLRETTRSLRQLADYLQRHPEALLRGRGPSGKDD